MKNIEFLSEIALTFISLDDLNTQMDRALGLIGRHIDVSRVYIFKDSEDGLTTSSMNEWCNQGINPLMNKLQNLNYSKAPSWNHMLLNEGMIHSDDVSELPPDIAGFLKSLGIKSILVYPLTIKNANVGFIGYDECRTNHRWSDIELELLKTISGIISSSIERNLLHEKLKASENNFRNFFNTIDDLFIIGNPDGEIIYTNCAVEKKLGYSRDELTTMNILELHPADKRDHASEILNEMIRMGRELCPLELISKKGNTLPVETRVWLGKWDGKDCIFGISKDLSKEQEALQKFTRLFDSNPALMAISNVNSGTITEVNSSFLSKLGYSRDEVTGRTSSDLGLFVDPAQRLLIADMFARTGSIRDVELLVKAKDGSLINGLFSGELIENFGEKSFLTVMVDITEQTALRKKVEEQRERLENIIEGTHLGTWEWNVKTGATIFNERWAQMAGYTLSELEPVSINTWLNICHPDDLKKSEEKLTRHFNRETEYYECESRILHKNGQWLWVLDRGKVIEWDRDGSPVMMFGTHTNITMQKMAELELRESHAELERFFSVNLDLLCIADTDGNFIKTNRAWEDILGYSSEELESRKFLEFVHPDDIDKTLYAMSQLSSQSKVLNFINRYRCRDGSYRFIEWRSHPYGKLIYAAARDITERINYEERIKEISIHDPLTEIFNRRHIFDRLESIISEYSRGGNLFSVSILDIDFFKKINDDYGHLAGDFILKEFAALINKNLRRYDLFGRYGGEEFIIISLNSSRKQTEITINRILSIVRQRVFTFNKTGIRFTFSAGISDSLEFGSKMFSSETIIERADNRLYAAKEGGRNRIVSADDTML